MGFINVFVSSSVYANIENKQLKLTKKESGESITYPLDDLSSVVFDNSQSVVSIKTLCKLSENNVIAYFCDEKHVPQTYLLAYNAYYKNLSNYLKQVEVKKPTLKNIWKNIVKQKIQNQIEVLNLLNKNHNLDDYLSKVQSDDSKNIESVVANKYFKILFGIEFNRREESNINGALNYGYAIIRGAIARSVVAHGLQPFLGIHHCNKLNNFNLVDDLIEPYRPLVDLLVCTNQEIFLKELNSQSKMILLNVLNIDVLYCNQKQSVQYSIENMVENYVKCITNNNFNINLPKIIKLQIHEYE